MAATSILALLCRHALTTAAGYLIAHGYLQNGQSEEFIGAGMLFAGVAWSWWQKSGKVLVTKEIAEIRGLKGTAPVIMLALLLFGCASATRVQAQPAPAATAGEASLLQRLANDAAAALDDANANNDTIAATCYKAIQVVAAAKLAATRQTGGGVLLAFQKVRDVARLNSSPIGTSLIVGCAPLVQDARLNFVQFFGNIGGAILLKGLIVP